MHSCHANSCLPTHPPRGPDCPFGNNATLCEVGTVPLSPRRAAARRSLGCIVGCGGFGGCDHTRLKAWAMCCVHVGRLEMPSAHLSRTMYRPECVSGRVFSILKLQLGRLCTPSWEAAFLLGCLGWQERACQLLSCSGVTLKCPLCSATVPWSELRLPPWQSRVQDVDGQPTLWYQPQVPRPSLPPSLHLSE